MCTIHAQSFRSEDAQLLYEQGHLDGALLMLLVVVAATSRKRYPHPQYGDREAFTKFLGEEIRNITGSVGNITFENVNMEFRGTMYPLQDLLYKFVRCELAHEATMPDDVIFVRDPKFFFGGGNSIMFNEVRATSRAVVLRFGL